jgi:hypothetical protein
MEVMAAFSMLGELCVGEFRVCKSQVFHEMLRTGMSIISCALRRYAKAGFAGLCIEDQTFPKRCAYAKGCQVVPHEEAVERVRATACAPCSSYRNHMLF